MALLNKTNKLTRGSAAIAKHLQPEDVQGLEQETPEVVEAQVEVQENIVPEVIDKEEQVVPEEVVSEQVEKLEPATPEIPNKPELTDEVVISFLSEKLNREIKTYDDLTPKEKELDPELKQLMEWKEKTGLPLSKWSEYNKDFSKMGDLDVAREILTQKHPNFTKEELDYKLKNFVYDEDYDEETDQMKKSIALKEFAQEGRANLEKNKLDLKPSNTSLSNEQAELIEYAKTVKERSENQSYDQAEYVRKLNESAITLNALNLKLSDNLEIKYDIPKGDKKALVDNVLSMPHWYDEKGVIKPDAVLSDGLKITHFNSIVDMVYQQGISVGKEELITSGGKPKAVIPSLPTGGASAKTGNVSEVVSKITGGTGTKLRFGKKKK